MLDSLALRALQTHRAIAMQLTLVVPQLAGATDAALPALARLARYAGGAPARSDEDLDRALLEAAGAAPATATAPLAAMGAGFDPGTAYVLRADPVALVAGRDDVLLSGRIDDLTQNEAASLLATLDAHFAQDGLAFHAPRPDAWFVTAREQVPVDADPLSSVRGPIQPHLPRGPFGPTWRRWLSEMQMLLHGHPVNAAREAAGRPLVTGIWVGGGGVRPGSLTLATALYAPAGIAGDVARGLALQAGSRAVATPARFTDLPPAADACVVVAVTPAYPPEALARDWLEPAVAALEAKALRALTVIGDGAGRTLRIRAEAPSWFARLRARLASAPGAAPGERAP